MRISPLRYVCLVILLAGCSSDDNAKDWQLREHSCEMPIPKGLSASDFRCGTMVMPLDRSAPDGAQVNVEVAVLAARGDKPARDPIAFFGGGPGIAELDSYLQAQATTALAPLNQERDIVFMDLRGTGRSKPSLDCPEYQAALVESFEQDLSAAEDGDILVDGFKKCRARLDAAGVPTSHFHSAAIVADMIDTLDAFGYGGKVNIYGISYGARIVQVFMRDHPERVRSAILDSPLLVDESFAAIWPAHFDAALDALSAACAKSASCAAAHTDLKQELLDLTDKLEKDPVVVDIDDKGTKRTLYISGHRLLLGVQGALSNPALVRLIPAAIMATAAGSTTIVETLAPSLLDPGAFSAGQYASVLGAEELPFDTKESLAKATVGVPAQITTAMRSVNADVFTRFAQVWPVDKSPTATNDPVSSDLPTLVLSGEFDPVAPPAIGKRAASTLSHGQWVMLPGHAHGILRSPHPDDPATPTCGRSIALAFLDAPDSPVDTSCIKQLPPLL